MQKFSYLAVGLLGVFLLAPVNTANGQQRQYRPSSPTVSPYLNLLRTNTSGLPNYYGLVRPQLQQRAFNTRESVARRQQQIGIQRLQSDLRNSQTLVSPTGKSSWFMNPGTRSSFMNTARYYSQVDPRR